MRHRIDWAVLGLSASGGPNIISEGHHQRSSASCAIRCCSGVPAESCIELKSLKYYLGGYRNMGIFYEAVTNRILDDLVAACRPRRMRVTGAFTARGGITTTVVAEHTSD